MPMLARLLWSYCIVPKARGLLLFLFALSLSGQPIPDGPGNCSPSIIGQGFASHSKKEVAWAAWCAGISDSQLGRWSEPLRTALIAAIASPEQSENSQLVPILIDALLRSHTDVPVPEAVALYPLFPDSAVALITRPWEHPDKDLPQLLDLVVRAEADENRARWLALASMLRRSIDFKRHLAERVRFEYSIDVIDDHGIHPVIALEGGPSGVMGGVRGAALWSNWPQVQNYCLTLSPRSGDEILVPTSSVAGVYLRRSRDPNACGTTNWKDHSIDVVRFLYSFAHCGLCSSGPRTREYPDILGGHADISWRSYEQVERSLVQTAEKYVEECREFLSALDEGNWSAEQVRPKVTITVSDQRRTKTGPLPSPGGVLHLALR
jgi:hypothetical protein